ncbi:hypothetical protein ACHAXT_005361 [Thalassiosira profunda]
MEGSSLTTEARGAVDAVAAAPATAAADAADQTDFDVNVTSSAKTAVAGNLQAMAALAEDSAASPQDSPQGSPTVPEMLTKKTSSDDANSEDASDVDDDASDAAIADEQRDASDFDMDIAPGHLHALSGRPNARLRGIPRHNSEGKLSSGSVDGTSRRSRSTSRSRAGAGRGSLASSRSSSPLPGGRHVEGEVGHKGDASTVGGTVSHAGRSEHSASHSSLDGMFDPDLLVDRLAFIDLDPPLPHEIRCGPLAAPGTIDGKSNNSGGLTPVNERLSEETLEDCHAFSDLVIDNIKHLHHGGMSSTMSMPSVAHSSLSGMRSDMSVGSLSNISVGSFKGGHSRGGSVAGGSLMGDGENSVLLGTLDEEGEDELDEAIEEENSAGESGGEEAAAEGGRAVEVGNWIQGGYRAV